MPGGASPSVERGTSLQPEPGGLLNGSALGSGDRLDLDRHLVDRAGKCRRDRIFLAHRCRQVLADIGTFVAGKCIGLGPRNPAFGGLLVKRGHLTRPSFGVSRTFGMSRPGSLLIAEGPRCPQAQSLALGMYQLLLQA